MLVPIILLVHAFLADCLWKDIGNLQDRGGVPWPCGRLGWAVVTLVFGLLAVVVYWLVHHSSLASVQRVPVDRRVLRRDG
jgi:hypothetical protein